MKWKQIAQKLIPPLIVDLFDTYRSGFRSRYPWEGVYQHYRDVPVKGKGFDGDNWAKMISNSMEQLAADQKSDSILPTNVMTEYAFLPLLAAILCKEAGTARILDFGGGAGIGYLHLLNSLADCRSIDYHIIETQRVCEVGRKFFKGDEHIHFHASLPKEISNVDVVYISSALQYIEDYRSLIQELSSFGPKYFFFDKLSAGNIPTYATCQINVKGSVIPYWFININEIITLLNEMGYLLSTKWVLEREYNQENFPEEYRLKRACSLMFSRNDAQTSSGNWNG